MPDRADIPDRVLPYKQMDLIGLGASSEVYRALDPDLRRTIAIKVQLVGASEAERATFASEARATARLEHPNVVPVYALGRTEEDRLCIAMQELRGQTLTQLVETATDWPSRAYFVRIVTTILRVADALGFAHELGYVHRDLKPDNVLVGHHGETYLLDWGLARHPRSPPVQGRDSRAEGDIPFGVAEGTEDGTIMGTPRFMSPEQADGDTGSIDPRTDVFGLGATLYFAMTRRAPFDAPAIGDALEAARLCRFKDPSSVNPGVALPTDLCTVVRRAMSARSEDRYSSIRAMSDDLERYLHAGDRVTLRRFAPGEVIVAEGDEAHEAFRILSGTCSVMRLVRGKPLTLRSMHPGEPFGETAIFGSSTRSATVTAETEVLVEVMSRADVEAWLAGDAWIAPFVQALATRFVRAEQARDRADYEVSAWRIATHLLSALRRDEDLSWSSVRADLNATWGQSGDVIDDALQRAGLVVRDDRLVSANAV
jgi:serine/threonine-protein kinase